MNLEDLSKRYKIIWGIIVTIILGAIGSGLWEIGLSPLFNNLVNFIVSFFSSISKDYENSIYIKVGDGNKDVMTHLFFHNMYAIFFLAPLFLLWFSFKTFLSRKWESSKEPKPDVFIQTVIKRRKLIFYFYIMPFCLFLSTSLC